MSGKPSCFSNKGYSRLDCCPLRLTLIAWSQHHHTTFFNHLKLWCSSWLFCCLLLCDLANLIKVPLHSIWKNGATDRGADRYIQRKVEDSLCKISISWLFSARSHPSFLRNLGWWGLCLSLEWRPAPNQRQDWSFQSRLSRSAHPWRRFGFNLTHLFPQFAILNSWVIHSS